MRYERGLGKVRRRKKRGKEVGEYFFILDGKPVYTQTRNKAEAQAFKLRYLADESRGLVSRSRETTVDQLLDLLEERYAAKIPRATDDDTRRKARNNLERLKSRLKHLRAFFGSRIAQQVTAKQVRDYVALREKAGRKPATINRDLESLRAAYELGKEEDLVQTRPAIKKLEEQNVREVFLEREQYMALRDAFDREAIRLFYVIAFHTGWRASHIMALKWEHVDFEQGLLNPPIKQAPNKKTGTAAPLYWDLRPQLEKAKMSRDRDSPECEYLIQSGGKRVLTYRAAWARACRLAGLPHLHVHDLRRTAARNMMQVLKTEEGVLKIVGWKTRQMLLRYNIVSKKDIVDAGRKLDASADAPGLQEGPVQ